MIESDSKPGPFIFLLFGASGSGKSTLIQELSTFEPRLSIHIKGTDREKRQYDNNEIQSKSRIRPNEYDYIYSQYGHKYGIQRKQIDDAIKNGQHHLIICNDIDTIQAIRSDYPGRVRVVFMQYDAPKEILLAYQKSRRISDDEISLRLEKIKVLNQMFIDRSDLFDAAIINKYGAPPRRMLTQLRRIIASEETPMSAQAKEIRKGLTGIADIVQMIQRGLQGQVEKDSVIEMGYLFIIMPMLSEDPLLDDTHAAIKRAAEKLGLRAERTDDITHADRITDKVLGSIRCAEYLVVDLTHERPNVYYELGYAHAFGKRTILTARSGTLMHFDVRGYPVIFYQSSVQLESKLVRLLRKFEAQKE